MYEKTSFNLNNITLDQGQKLFEVGVLKTRKYESILERLESLQDFRGLTDEELKELKFYKSRLEEIQESVMNYLYP